MATSTPNQAKAPALLLLGRKRVLTPLRFGSLYPQPLERTEVVVGRCEPLNRPESGKLVPQTLGGFPLSPGSVGAPCPRDYTGGCSTRLEKKRVT